jgi:tetratricopeptide (TPR) repeat protein
VADLDKAIALRPEAPEARSLRAEMRGTPESASDAVLREQARVDRDPLDSNAWVGLGVAYMGAGDFDRARKALGRALEIAPGHSGASWNTCVCLIAAGQPEEALALASRSPYEWLRLTCTALAQSDLGRKGESRAALEALIERWAGSSAIQVAEIHAWRGEADRAFEWLDRAFAQRDVGMLWVRIDPLFRKVHGDPRWKPFLRKMTLPPD